MSFIEMSSHKLRSALSILGVMLGVASLVAMLTLIGGIDKFINKKMGRWAGSIWFMKQRDASDDEKISWSRSPGIRFSDGKYLKNSIPEVKLFFRSIERRGTIYVLGHKERAHINGTDRVALEYDMEDILIDKGRWLSDEDYKKGNRVCLISWQLEERLKERMRLNHKETKDLIGRNLIYKNIQLTIVGIFKPEDPDFKAWHLSRSVYIPLKTMQRYITGLDPTPGAIRLLVEDPKTIIKQATKISYALKQKHRGVEDFEYRTAEWIEEIRGMLNNISLLMAIVSVISLLVGGLSIMNVMLSSISERIYEIGIRKALGAQKLQIFVQFISETATLSLTGGTVGLFLGMIPLFFKEGVRKSTQGAVEPTIILVHIVYVFTIIVSVGILFGLYPAVKASRMNPVEALRYE